jgi:hypothetical protein
MESFIIKNAYVFFFLYIKNNKQGKKVNKNNTYRDKASNKNNFIYRVLENIELKI